MAIELQELEIDGETYEARFNTPETGDADACVVVVPGAGHGPFGDIFDVTMYELVGEGVASFRFETWTDQDELGEKTLEELHAELDAAVAHVEATGYDTIFLLVKSFGGRIAFTALPDAVERVLGWAPAVDIADESTLEDVADVPLGEHDGLDVAASDVADVDVPVRLLYGTDDHLYPEPAESFADALPTAELRTIDGENHSFNEQRRAVVAETLAYLAPTS